MSDLIKPEDGYVAYIVNPKSGASSHNLIACQFKSYLIKAGFKVRASLTKSLAHAGELAEEAAVDFNCAMVVAAGGDGTVREVAHGLEGSDRPLMMLPCGTENLLANELGFDEKFKTIKNAFEDGEICSLDLGSANGKCFTSITGFGFDGDIVHSVSSRRIGHINHFDYFWPIWRTFWGYKFPAMRVEVDGEEIFNGRGLVFVGNISRYAVGLQILYDADFSDGLLDICIYKCASRLHLVKHSAMTAIKRHSNCCDVIYRQGKEVKVFAVDSDVKSEIDGDPGPDLPLDINIIPHAVKVIVPKDAKPAGIRARIIRAIG